MSWIANDGWGGIEEGIERSPVHEIDADEAGEGERAFDGFGGLLSEPQDEEGDEGDGDLNAHGVLGGPEEVADFEGLLDPAEEQLDLPAALVDLGDLLGGGVEIVGEDARSWPKSGSFEAGGKGGSSRFAKSSRC